ncbi:MAG: hypothetical protein NTW16_17385 [Bacteroidetes bacterium]|nr:hypothetical protein [Bacteroidota bacterium]
MITFVANMKRILLFFFFLLLFNQCDQVEIMPPVIIHGAGQDKTMAAGRANGNSFGAALRSDPARFQSGKKTDEKEERRIGSPRTE